MFDNTKVIRLALLVRLQFTSENKDTAAIQKDSVSHIVINDESTRIPDVDNCLVIYH